MKRLGSLLLLVACRRSPTAALSWRESWEMLVFTDSGGIVDARVTVGNTGLLRGQGHLRFDHWPEDESPVLLSRDAAPEAVQVSLARDQVWIGTDLFSQEEDQPGRWYVRTSSPGASGLMHVEPGGPTPAPAAWQEGGGQWTVTAPVTLGAATGWVEAGQRGGSQRGRGVVLHRAGDGWPGLPRQAAFVLGSGLAVGIDRQGAGQLAWAEVDGRSLDTSSAKLSFPQRGPVELDLRPAADLQVEIKRRGRSGRRAPYTHLNPAELWLLSEVTAIPRRHVQKGHATVTFEGHVLPAPAILLWVDDRGD